jgi:hypothetical protein
LVFEEWKPVGDVISRWFWKRKIQREKRPNIAPIIVEDGRESRESWFFMLRFIPDLLINLHHQQSTIDLSVTQTILSDVIFDR